MSEKGSHDAIPTAEGVIFGASPAEMAWHQILVIVVLRTVAVVLMLNSHNSEKRKKRGNDYF